MRLVGAGYNWLTKNRRTRYRLMVSAVSLSEFGLVTLFSLFTEFGQSLRSKLKAQLQHLCAKLAEVCPSVVQVKDSFLPSHCILIEILGGIQTVHRG